jgi:hypothetical protein
LLSGISRWLNLREAFARALDPVILTRTLDGVTPLTLLAQAGPGLEALGYLLLIEDGATASVAARSSLKSRLERIVQEVAHVMPFDGPTWVASTVAAYNGLKHANRAAPRDLDLVNAWRESVLTVRAWVALRLGTPENELATRLAADPQANAWIAR